MGTIVDAIVPTAQFALSDTFDALDDVEFESLRVVAHESDHRMPLLWGSASDLDSLDAELEADGTTTDVTRLAECDDRRLYRVEWHPEIRHVLGVLVEEYGTLLRANGRNERWKLRVLFPDHDAVSSTYEFCKERGLDLSIRRVNGVGELVDHGGIELSDGQYEALMTAFETDYYSVPRGQTLESLSEELGVSHQALSERLRRGHRNLIQNTLYDDREPVERYY
ncbi:helix-turn-helix domain-containing protein [Haloarchaeobius sp. HRN-SO-5]|uniref:helix-turn-helix domain-containing protein n=1 Tax=Haloarchaeobius sp. HRN-SO-5 TaxID=3446118 RepID=UPI003EBCE87C